MKPGIAITMLFLALMTTGYAQDWKTDFDQAKALAKKDNKLIIMVFQGSDWCAPCMKLNREIWSSPAFKDYAKDHFVMLKVDFPRKRANALSPEQQKKNNALAEKYNAHGYFPFVVIMNPQGEVIGETGYKKMTPEEYIRHLLSFKK